MKIHSFFRNVLILLLPGALSIAIPARAAFNVIDYWRMGENDSAAITGGYSTNTLDPVGARTLTNIPVSSAFPIYTKSVSSTATADTGSQLALQMSGTQGSVGAVIPALTDNFGIEMWARPTTTTAGTRVLAYNGNTSVSGWGIIQSGAIYQALFGGNAIFGTAAATAGAWTHLALVRTNGTATLYINGSPAGSVNNPPSPPTGNFLVGANNFGTENFSGAIDEVRVFTFGTGEFNITNLLYFQGPSFTVSSANISVGASAGTSSMNVSVNPSNVSWTATANASWLHVSTTNGTGSGTVMFTFDDNTYFPRSGTLTIGGQTVTVSQAAPSYSLSGDYSGYWTGIVIEEPWTEGNDSVSITVTPNTGIWSVTSYASWIHPTPNGAGSGTISFSFDANTDPNGGARSGQVFINNGANSFLRFVVFQQAPPSGAGQATYHFTGRLSSYLPQYIPANASAALKSVQNGDVFYLTMTLVPSAGPIAYEDLACGVNNITFSVPSRGLSYTKSFADLQVLHDANNPNSLRWDANGVDSTVNMLFWARDFTKTALNSGNVPNPLDLSGFHANGFSQVILFNGVGQNPELFYGDLVPMPALNLRQQQNTNLISWATSDAFYQPTLEATSEMGPNAVWTPVTNPPVASGLTNLVTLPATTNGSRFFRLKVL